MLFESTISREYKMQNIKSFRGLRPLNPHQGSALDPLGREGAYSVPQLVWGLIGPHHFLIASDGPDLNWIVSVKATSHSTIFDILMRPVRKDQRYRRRFTR